MLHEAYTPCVVCSCLALFAVIFKCKILKIVLAERFKKLQQAKDVLTDPAKRKDYDLWRQSGMAISYEKWCNMNESVRTVSIHLAHQIKLKYNLESTVYQVCTQTLITRIMS